jgi:hypothetical protein
MAASVLLDPCKEIHGALVPPLWRVFLASEAKGDGAFAVPAHLVAMSSVVFAASQAKFQRSHGGSVVCRVARGAQCSSGRLRDGAQFCHGIDMREIL